MNYCYKCGNEWKEDFKPGMRESCERCNEDLHCCLNCHHYNPSLYNTCGETMAERQPDNAASNNCSHFIFKDLDSPDINSKSESTSKAKDAFKNLFSD